MFNEKERLLANEAHLTKSLISSGLHALRKANIENVGLFYQAFFSLSIGLERMMKIILIMKYRIENNGEFPSNELLKKHGHNLVSLAQDCGIEKFDNKINNDILTFLNQFAKKERYFNLDSLRETDYNRENPLLTWKKIQEKILNTYSYKKLPNEYLYAAQILNQCSDVQFNNLNNEEITSVQDLVVNVYENDIAQGYAVWHIFEIVKTLKNRILYLEQKRYLMPVVSEFFDFYTDYWKPSQIRNRKNWLNI